MKNIAKTDNKRRPKITPEMNGKGLTVHAGLLPVLNFMEKLIFRKRVHKQCIRSMVQMQNIVTI